MSLITVVHDFNPSPREDLKWKETARRFSLILRLLEAGSPFQTEVEVKNQWMAVFTIRIFRLNPNF